MEKGFTIEQDQRSETHRSDSDLNVSKLRINIMQSPDGTSHAVNLAMCIHSTCPVQTSLSLSTCEDEQASYQSHQMAHATNELNQC